MTHRLLAEPTAQKRGSRSQRPPLSTPCHCTCKLACPPSITSPSTPPNTFLPEMSSQSVISKNGFLPSSQSFPAPGSLTLRVLGTLLPPHHLFPCVLSRADWPLAARRPRNPRDQTVPLHGLAGPRGPLPRHWAAGLRPAGEIQEPAQRRPAGGALQVSGGRARAAGASPLGVMETFGNPTEAMVEQRHGARHH